MALEFLEDYLATIDNLPSEIRHHFSELKEKDVMFQDLRRQILKETQGLQKTPATEANIQKEDDIAGNIRREYGEAKVLVDEKIDIADRTLALLESHIRRLDMELGRMQFDFDQPLLLSEDREQSNQLEMDDLLSMFTTSTQPSAFNALELTPIPYGAAASLNNKKRKALVPGSKAPSNKKRRREDDWDDDGSFDGYINKAEDEEREEEQVYCTCQRVSFGEMVGCDNPAGCPFGEWFHLECVGLREPPKGSWVCPQCRAGQQLGYISADKKKKKN